MEKAVKLYDIIEFLKQQCFEYEIIGNVCDISIEGFSSLTNYKTGTITWVKNEKNWLDDREEVTLCVVQRGIQIPCALQIVSNDSKAIFFSILEHFWGKMNNQRDRVGKYTYIGPDVVLGDNVCIGNNCSITGRVTIGNDTIIADNVVIQNKVKIGERCQIQSLTVIGEDGFGCSEDENHKKKMVKHYGGVVIGDDVFIGSHVNIACGTIDDTCIQSGVKIAPSTHIGHNNQIGEDSVVICSQLYGSVQLAENAYVVGSIIRNQCSIGTGTMIGMGTVVTKDIEAGKLAIGIPAKVIKDNK